MQSFQITTKRLDGELTGFHRVEVLVDGKVVASNVCETLDEPENDFCWDEVAGVAGTETGRWILAEAYRAARRIRAMARED